MKAEVEKFWEGPLWGEPPREQFTLNPAGAQVPGETQRRGLEEKAGPTLGKSRRASRRVSNGTALCSDCHGSAWRPGVPRLPPPVGAPELLF